MNLESKLREQIGDKLLDYNMPVDNRLFIKVDPSVIKDAAKIVRDAGYDMPISAGATDYIKENRFEVFWVLWSTTHKKVLILKTDINREEPEVESLVDIWKGVQKFERETWELMGINYKGHPRLKPLLLPDDWNEGYPLRKDFSLKPYKV